MLAISIVSHNQGHLIKNLLHDLTPIIKAGAEVILTLNTPEDESFINEFTQNIIVIRNKRPLGFGENHNNANLQTKKDWFAVLNPDVRCETKIFEDLFIAHTIANAGVVAPRVIGVDGKTEDSIRRYPSILRILSRVLCRILGRRLTPDYELHDERHICVDWVAGMFLLFKSDNFRKIGGFDTRYFMYLEDADICRRLNSLSFPTVVVPEVSVFHDARRATGRSLQHFRWHLLSLFRFLFIAKHIRQQPPLSMRMGSDS